MKVTDWLIGLDPHGLYTEDVLAELRPYGVRYIHGVLMSTRQDDLPYITYGRVASVPFKTPRELVAAAGRLGYGLEIDHERTEPRAFGFEIVTTVWRLLRPILVTSPPSSVVPDPRRKAALDIQALRRYGY